MFHEGHGPPVLSWHQEKVRSVKKNLAGRATYMVATFAATTKKTRPAGLNGTGGFVCALSVFVTRSLTLLGQTANEVRGQRAPGSQFFDLFR